VSENFGRSAYGLHTYTGQVNDFELISAIKMETRNAIEGYFGSEFPAICNHCGIWRPEVARR